jgi:hypothetical protein
VDDVVVTDVAPEEADDDDRRGNGFANAGICRGRRAVLNYRESQCHQDRGEFAHCERAAKPEYYQKMPIARSPQSIRLERPGLPKLKMRPWKQTIPRANVTQAKSGRW